MKSSNIGGQAVLEGVMMRNAEKYAVAVRKPNGEIETMQDTYHSVIKWKKLTTMPFVRGMFNLVDSMVLGVKTLNYSAEFYADEEEESEVELSEKQIAKREKMNNLIMAVTTIFSFVLALGIFMLAPYTIIQFLGKWIDSHFLLSIIEGLIRILLFVSYILLVSLAKDINRTFMYHGAEHKCINCIESGLELNVENVRKSSKVHRRCGTSFIFFVLLISIITLFFIRTDVFWLKIILRIALLPVIAGVSYELIKWAGNSENPIILALSRPGMWMQSLTTKEPDDSMIEVAIASVEAVFDWKTYIGEMEHDA